MNKRLTYFNKDLDNPDNYPGICESNDENPNLVGSLCSDGFHRPALDIDLPCELVPSTTEGHFHLYIDWPMTLPNYRKLVKALIEAGIMQESHLQHLDNNGTTLLRLPNVRKPPRARDSQ